MLHWKIHLFTKYCCFLFTERLVLFYHHILTSLPILVPFQRNPVLNPLSTLPRPEHIVLSWKKKLHALTTLVPKKPGQIKGDATWEGTFPGPLPHDGKVTERRKQDHVSGLDKETQSGRGGRLTQWFWGSVFGCTSQWVFLLIYKQIRWRQALFALLMLFFLFWQITV